MLSRIFFVLYSEVTHNVTLNQIQAEISRATVKKLKICLTLLYYNDISSFRKSFETV